MRRDQRFPVVLSKGEKAVLQRLAEAERLSSAAVVRRLIWREAQQRGLLSPADQQRASGAGQAIY
ncbi:MAG: hypothetical protein JXA14_26590 [Anaerolineae bacterium]|nr:hypothetical protein [Anaerolineae bacterium]